MQEKIAAVAVENIVAVYNMDMIAWDVRNLPKLRIYTRAKRDPGHEGDMVIANTFLDVVNKYELDKDLIPVITPKGGHWGGHWSDQASFWDEGIFRRCVPLKTTIAIGIELIIILLTIRFRYS